MSGLDPEAKATSIRNSLARPEGCPQVKCLESGGFHEQGASNGESHAREHGTLNRYRGCDENRVFEDFQK